jgi:hypothetical protein
MPNETQLLLLENLPAPNPKETFTALGFQKNTKLKCQPKEKENGRKPKVTDDPS